MRGTHEEAEDLVKRGERQREMGQFHLAEVLFHQALGIYERLPDCDREISHACGHLGITAELQKMYGEASMYFGDAFRYARQADDRGAVAVALRHLGALEAARHPSSGVGLVLLRAAIIVAPGSLAHRAWFRLGLAKAYCARSQFVRSGWHLLRALLELALGWPFEKDKLKKRVWMLMALRALGQTPLVGRVSLSFVSKLAKKWELKVQGRP